MSDKNFNTNEQGIPSVLGNKTKKTNKAGYLLLGAALALGLGLAYASTSDNDKTTIAAKEDEKQHLTSSKELTTTKLPSREERMQMELEEKKAQEAEAKEAAAGSSLPYALPDVQVADGSNTNMFGEKVMTLDDKKFQAPMMGKIQTSTESVGAYGQNQSNNNDMPFVMGEKEKTPTHLRKDLASQLESVATPQAYASKMADRSLTLAKGTMIECILETRIDTSVPAMTSCVIPRDVYSHNGRVLLLERGTRAVGEYQGSVQNGLDRIFMLWTELRTPNGIVIPIGSPTTDALGAGGAGGYVDHHWWKRFGNALMFSMVADGVDYAIANASRNQNNSNVTVSYANTDNGISEIVKAAMEQSGNIPPTLIKNQGERVGIFVARDLSFASVYELNKVGN